MTASVGARLPLHSRRAQEAVGFAVDRKSKSRLLFFLVNHQKHGITIDRVYTNHRLSDFLLLLVCLARGLNAETSR